MAYNLTLLQNASGFADVAQAANSFSGSQLLFQLLIAAAFIIMLAVYRRSGFVQSMAVSGFVCFILSFFLVSAKFIPQIYIWLFLAITGFSVYYMYMVER